MARGRGGRRGGLGGGREARLPCDICGTPAGGRADGGGGATDARRQVLRERIISTAAAGAQAAPGNGTPDSRRGSGGTAAAGRSGTATDQTQRCCGGGGSGGSSTHSALCTQAATGAEAAELLLQHASCDAALRWRTGRTTQALRQRRNTAQYRASTTKRLPSKQRNRKLCTSKSTRQARDCAAAGSGSSSVSSVQEAVASSRATQKKRDRHCQSLAATPRGEVVSVSIQRPGGSRQEHGRPHAVLSPTRRQQRVHTSTTPARRGATTSSSTTRHHHQLSQHRLQQQGGRPINTQQQ